jgi:hypothetical protein
MLKRCLAKLRGHLRRWVVHELTIGTKDISSIASLLLVWVSAVSLMRLRRPWRRRRRPELRHCRDMLRYGMMQRGRLPVICALHGRCDARSAKKTVFRGREGRECERSVVMTMLKMCRLLELAEELATLLCGF